MSADDNTIKITAFGDSLSAGYGLPAAQGFAPVLEQTLRRRGYSVRVINASISGDTSSDGLLRVDWMLEDKPDIVIVEFGANDMFRGAPVAFITQNLSKIITRLQQRGARVLLAGIKAPKNHNEQYRQRLAQMYENLRDAHGVRLYPFFLEGVALRPRLNLDDGIHPNADGIRVIVNNIAPAVIRLIDNL